MPILSSVLAAAEPVVAAWLVRTSWQAVVLIALVAAVQLTFGRWLSPRWKYALWTLVFVRLLMPVLPASPTSIFNARVPQAPVKMTVARAEQLTPPTAGETTVTIVKTFDFAEAIEPSNPIDVLPAAKPFDWRRALLSIW